MQHKTLQRLLTIGALTLALGVSAPSIAMATDEATDPLDESQPVLVTAAEPEDEALVSDVRNDEGDTQEAEEASENETAFDGVNASTGDAEPIVSDSVDDEDADDETSDGDPTDEDADDETSDGGLSDEDADATDATPAANEPEVAEGTAAAMVLAAQGDETTTDDECGEAETEVDNQRIIEDGTYVFSSKLKRTMVLDVAKNSSKSGANVQIYTSGEGAGQKWDIRYVKDGLYRILKHGTQMALAIKGNTDAAGTNVQLAKVSSKKGQLWRFVDRGNGYYNIVSYLNARLALGVSGGKSKNGTNVQVAKNKNYKGQSFALYPVVKVGKSDVKLADGTYSIKATHVPSYSVNVKDDANTTDANIQLYKNDDSQYQRFYFKSDGKGYYYIFVVGSGKVLSPKNGSVIPGTNVLQATYRGTSLQKWSLQQTNNGNKLVNKATNLALDVSGGKYKNGANIRVFRNNSSRNRRFNIEKVNALTDGIYTISSLKASSKVVEIEKASTKSGAAAQLGVSDNSLAQRFEIVSIGDDLYRIRTAASGGWLTNRNNMVVQYGNHSTAVTSLNSWKLVWNDKYFSLQNVSSSKLLDLRGGKTNSGTKIQVSNTGKGNRQYFAFTPSNLIEEGTYIIKSGLGTVLDVESGAKTNGANIQASDLDGSTAQQFKIKAVGSSDNTYSIVNVNSNKAIEVAGSSEAKGANVQQNKYKGASNQRWVATIADGGRVAFVNDASGLILEVKGNTARSGANVRQNTPKDTKSQGWSLQRFGWFIEDGEYLFYDTKGKVKAWNKSAYNSWKKIKNMKSETKYLGALDQHLLYTTFFKRQGEVWVPVQNWLCSVNAHGRTPLGTYKIKSKAEYVLTHFGTGSWYWSHWGPDYQAFHSVLTKPGSKVVTFTGLGRRNTSGCVRCPMNKAQWVYEHAPKGTTVYSYR